MALSNPLKFFSSFLSVEAKDKVGCTSAEQEIQSILDNLEREAIVTETISPRKRGQVRFQGSWWAACCLQDITILPNEAVYVVGRQNITLLVEPASQHVPQLASSSTFHVFKSFPMF